MLDMFVGDSSAHSRVRVEHEDTGRLPVADVSAPAVWVVDPCLEVETLARLEDFVVKTDMTLVGGDKLQSAVAMPVVVPVYKGSDPAQSIHQGVEGRSGEVRTIFQGAKQGLGIGVVIADAGARKGGCHTQSMECG